ncbi:MAG: hypothetical protein KDJ86_19935 [Bauldia sp.]|uniref:hypothetical protein n=1 Tax=Bauldia sp. TaxID=2575872 RepID=UPI001DFA1E27|nr:hypothetical protein [Bauldia sp.]MCB1489143.1 hypothetical protein [Bauldia sp.]MCB1498065.1 hypothetical protein [Bauldia sp.]
MALKDAPSGASAGDSARYIEAMAKELRTIASRSDLGFLAFLLRMVEDDAGAEAGRRDSEPKA